MTASEALWRIQLLGDVRATPAGGGRVVSRFRTVRARSLFCFLAYRRDRAETREALSEMLWPESDPEAARSRLRQLLTSLRRQLEPPGVPPGTVVVADRLSVRLSGAACATDAADAAAALQAARRAREGPERTALLARAVDLGAGELCPGEYLDWALGERQRLRGEWLSATQDLALALEREGDLPRALEAARRAAQADPLREEARRLLIRLLAVSGERSLALAEWRDLEAALARNVGATPDPATRELVKRIERGESVAKAGSAPGAPAAAVARAAAPALAVEPPAPSGRSPVPRTGLVTVLAARGEGVAEALRPLVAAHRGVEVPPKGPGVRAGAPPRADSDAAFAAAFSTPSDALACARAALEGTAREAAVALVTAEGREAGAARARRLAAAAHPGQLLCAEETAALLRPRLRPPATVVELGAYRLSPVAQPERILEVRLGVAPAREHPAPRAEPAREGRLPPRLTRFFGREEELARIDLALEGGARLLTLTGPAGVGKTRLATEAAHRARGRVGGAAWLVELAGLADPEGIAGAVRDALRLGASRGVGPLDQVAGALGGDPALLVLDNVDHLLGPEGATAAAGATAVVGALLERVPRLALLLTSRRRLGVAWEREVPLAPLPVPRGGETAGALAAVPSVALLVDRAQSVRADFQVTPANAAALAELCARLDGLPLAIELAAGRAQVLTPAQMVEHLGGARFDLLTARRGAGTRHDSLRGAIDESAALLPRARQAFFARLSAFRGSFSLEAAGAVAGAFSTSETGTPLPGAPPGRGSFEALDALAELRDASLVTAEGEGAERRFRLLESLREYASSRLVPDEAAALARAHAAWFVSLAERGCAAMSGPSQAAWLERLGADLDNLRAAFAWALREEPPQAVRLASALAPFLVRRGHATEWRGRLAAALARAPARTTARAHALRGAGSLALEQSDIDGAGAHAAESRAVACEVGDLAAEAAAVRLSSGVARERGDLSLARTLAGEALALARRGPPSGDEGAAVTDAPAEVTAALVLSDLATIDRLRGDIAAARLGALEAVAALRALGHRHALAAALMNVGVTLRLGGDLAGARAALDESHAVHAELGDEAGVAHVLSTTSTLLRDLGDVAGARRALDVAVATYRRLGSQGLGFALVHLASMAREDDLEAAESFAEEALAFFRRDGHKRGVATSLGQLGAIALARGELPLARERISESLRVYRDVGSQPAIAARLFDLALVEERDGAPERAARLAAAGRAIHAAQGVKLMSGDAKELDDLFGRLGERLGATTLASLLAEGRALSWVDAITYALRA